MYRQRLRSTTGCLRCKKRHYKCDEMRPRCAFCARHNLTCIWPTIMQTRRNRNERLALVVSQKVDRPSRSPTGDEGVPSLDPFHTLPVDHVEDKGVITKYLYGFFMGIAQGTMPFDVATSHYELTRGWLESVYSDEVVCSSFVTYCAWFCSERMSQRGRLGYLSFNSQARSLALLRNRIETDEVVSEGTLLAAVLQFFIATFSTDDVTQLSRIAQGISALITAKGGSDVTVQNVSPSTRASLIIVDIFTSLLSAQKPFLTEVRLPSKPISYDLMFTDSEIDKEIVNCLGQDLTDVLKDLRFALFFRAPSRQTRRLSMKESQYLYVLLQKIGYKLCMLQCQFATSQSLSEIALYGMICVKEEVLLDIVQHPIMSITFLRRFRSAISVYHTPLRGTSLTIALWATIMALVRTELESERSWAAEFVVSALNDRYGLSWPPNWDTQMKQEIQQVLWHYRIDMAFTRICASIYRLHEELRR